jgi:ATP-dependent helicase/nuclease subunit B
MRVPAELMAAATAGLTVLTPTGELATALTDAVEREHRRLGHEVWPTPRIRELSSWLRELSPRCLTDLEERELWRAIVEDSEVGRDFIDAAAGARAARRARRTMQEYALPWRALEDEPAAETQAFLLWNQEFERRCRALGRVSVDTLLDSAPPPVQPITWLESPAWRPLARQWLARHGAPLRPVELRNAAASGPHILKFEAASPDLELAAAAGWAALNVGAHEGFRAWVHVRDLNRRRTEVIDAFDAALIPGRFVLREDRAAVPYAVAGGTPLADYAPVRAALQLLDASVAVMSFQNFSELLRSPDMHLSVAESVVAARLELVLRERAPSQADLATWLDLAEDCARAIELVSIGAVQRLRQSLQQLQPARDARSFSIWVPVWMAAIEAAPWNFRSRWSSTEFQAAERFRELLGDLAAADAVLGSHTRASAQRVLRRAARDTPFQPQTGVPPIWISGQDIDPWLNYDGLWITGCSDDRWPAPVAPIAFLPIRLQREAGVTAAAADLQMQAAVDLQRRWQARATTCVFSWAHAAEGLTAAPSPLLPAGAALLNDSMPPVRTQPHWHAMQRAAPPLERFSDELAPPFSVQERTRGVATLRDQSRCAFRAFADTRLRTEQLYLPVPGFNVRERGDLVHYSLEHVWTVLGDSNELAALQSEPRRELLSQAARQAVARVCKRRDPGQRWREREVVRLEGLLDRWLEVEAQRAPFRVEHIEAAAQPTQFAGVDFRARIDRIDSLADGARVLIDYKTNSTSPDWRGERPHNPQLPIYALMRPEALVAVAYGRVNAAKLEFVTESERADVFKPGKRKTSLEEQPTFSALMQLWRTRIERLASDFAAGRAEVAPTAKACATCRLQGLCRVPAALDPEEVADE